MIRLFIVIIYIINYISLVAQPFGKAENGYRIQKSFYENSSGEKGKTEFIYDSKNKLVQSFWHLIDTSRYSNNYYEHDSQKNLTSSFRDFSDGITSFELFIHDSNGNKTEEYFFRSDSVAGFAKYFYDNGLLLRSEYRKYKGWLTCNIDYIFSENRLTKGIITNENKKIGEVIYDYDESGNLKNEHWDFNGKWSQTFINFYEKIPSRKNFYSSPFILSYDNHKITDENYTFNDETGGPSKYIYNNEGLLIEKIFTRNDGISTKTSYEYDKERRLIASLRKISDNKIMTFKYFYDERDLLTNRNCYEGDSLTAFESYYYNDSENLVKAYLKNFDGWLSGIINFDEYKFGKLSSGEFKGENGFDAKIYFNYNDSGLLKEIYWDFSFGKFQRYNFNYSK